MTVLVGLGLWFAASVVIWRFSDSVLLRSFVFSISSFTSWEVPLAVLVSGVLLCPNVVPGRMSISRPSSTSWSRDWRFWGRNPAMEILLDSCLVEYWSLLKCGWALPSRNGEGPAHSEFSSCLLCHLCFFTKINMMPTNIMNKIKPMMIAATMPWVSVGCSCAGGVLGLSGWIILLVVLFFVVCFCEVAILVVT